MSFRARARQAATLLILILAPCALFTQLGLVIRRTSHAWADLLAGLNNYFSFFTILTNVLVLLSVLLPLSSRHSAAGRFFMRFAVRSAVLSYIAVVAIVNVLLLRHLQELHGLDALNERIFHDAVPALFLIYWLLLDERTALPWRLVTTWMLYPGAYVAYVLVRGALIHRYPYPFIDVTQLGYRAAVINGLAVLVGFAAMGFLVVALNRTLLRRVTSP